MAQRRRPRQPEQLPYRPPEGAGSVDNGEGCSYSWDCAKEAYSSSVAAASPLKASSASEEACWCSSAGNVKQRRRRTRRHATSTATSLALLAIIPFLPLAQAVPFGKGSSRSEKGKEKAAIAAQDIFSDNCIYADTATYHHDGLTDILPKFNGYSQQQQEPAHKITRSKRAAPAPAPLPGHYVYQDGQWVPSADWHLNGREGTAQNNDNDTDVSSSRPTTKDGLTVDSADDTEAQMSLDDGEGGDAALEADPDSLDEDSLGWAPTTNAMLGVDLDPSQPTSSSTPSTNTRAPLPTRTNLAHLSSTSTPASAVASGSSAPSTSGGIVAYDFSHDVPNGWVNDGRTPAYAVPVIIGVSVVLAIIIFTLVLIFVRGARRRKRRRKYGMKLQEEGDMPTTRPTSPSSQNNQNGDDEDDDADMSRGARAPNGEIIYDEKKKQRIISRRWSLGGGQHSLRKRRGKIAKLLNRKGPIVQEVVPSSATASAHQRTSSRELSPPLRRRRLSQQSEESTSAADSTIAVDADQISDTNRSRSPSSASMARDASSVSSIVNDGRSPTAEEAGASITASADSPSRPSIVTVQQPTISLVQPTHDSHNVPLPAVGPPAYIHPPSPAYTSNTLDEQQTGYFAGEKRALLNHTPAQSGSGSLGASSSDPYRQQRRYEHLYTSRDGADAEREQRTGAPQAGPSSSGSAFRIAAEEDDEEEEAQQPLRAHIAVDDKGLLNRIRQAASAPSQPPSADAEPTIEGTLDASAPPLSGLPELEDGQEHQLSRAQPSSSARSMLPAPPRAVVTSLSAISPLLDEKTRLRQAEEQQAASMMSAYQPSAPEFPSSASAYEPSVPDFTSYDASNEASAPPLDEEHMNASAPPLSDLGEDDHNFSNRPHLEGVV